MSIARLSLHWVIFVLAATLNLGGYARADSNHAPTELDYSEYLTDQARFDWVLQCQGCHGPKGEGLAKRDVPKLQDEVSKFLLVDGGRDFIVRVPGVSGSPLSDDRLADLLNWMLVSLDPGNLRENWKNFSAHEIQALRSKPLRTEIEDKRTSLMAQIEAYIASRKHEVNTR